VKEHAATLLAAEIFIIIFISGVLCSSMIFTVNSYANEIVRKLFIR